MKSNSKTTMSLLALVLITATMGQLENSSVNGVQEFCTLKLDGCLELLPNEIAVPENVVGIDGEFRSCAPSFTVKSETADHAAILFLIDHSGSMKKTDRDAARYSVPKKILEDIYSADPNTEVGIVAFGKHLAYDSDESSITEAYNGSDIDTKRNKQEGFVKLTPLNSRTPDGQTGIKELRSLLETVDASQLGYTGKEVCSNGEQIKRQSKECPRNGTAISLAMNAVRQAFDESKAKKERQFVIFLSDGRENSKRRNPPFETRTDIPATFTIWFGGEPDSSLIQFDETTRNSDYSIVNGNSQLWSLKEVNEETLTQLVQNEILNLIFTAKTDVNEAVVNGKSPERLDGVVSYFNQPFALNEDATEIDYFFRYVIDKSVIEDSIASRLPDDTTQAGKIRFVRSANATFPGDATANCQDYSLQAYHDNAPIEAISSVMSSVEMQATGYPGPQSVDINLQSQFAVDQLNLLASSAGEGVWKNSFPIEINQQVGIPDNKLQLQSEDTVVASWTHPDLPLATISLTLPFRAFQSVAPFSASYHDDEGADGIIDRISVLFYQDLNPQEIAGLQERITLPAHRNLSIEEIRVKTNGFDILVASASEEINTAVDDRDKLIFTGQPNPITYDWFLPDMEMAIEDSLAPVILSAKAEVPEEAGGDAFLDVTFSEPVQFEEDYSQFPFEIFRKGSNPNGKIQLSSITEGSEQELRFVMNSEVFPVAGDSITRVIATELIRDVGANSNPLNPQTSKLIEGEVPTLEIVAAFDGGGWYESEEEISPVQLDVPVFLKDSASNRCINCTPGSPSEQVFRPVGLPEPITLRVTGPFKYSVRYYTHLGEFFNKAEQTVTQEMLDEQNVSRNADGEMVLVFAWYPVDENQVVAGTGAYIAKVEVVTMSTDEVQFDPVQGMPIKMQGTTTRETVRFGYVRNQ